MGGAAGAGTSALAAALALLVLSAGVAYTSGGRDPGAVLAWSVRSDPSRWDDVAYAVCEYGDYIYVVGAQDTNHGGYLRVEARSKFDGSLVGAWSADNLTFYAYSADCAIAGGLLYVAYGGWSVAVFDLQLNLLNRVVEPEYVPGGVTSVAVGDGYLYLAGYEFVEGGYSRWRVGKWSVDGASLVRVKVYVSDPTPLSDEAMQVAVNPVTGHLWVVGHEADYRFRVEILDQDLNLVRSVSNRSRWLACAVDFDENATRTSAGAGSSLSTTRTVTRWPLGSSPTTGGPPSYSTSAAGCTQVLTRYAVTPLHQLSTSSTGTWSSSVGYAWAGRSNAGVGRPPTLGAST